MGIFEREQTEIEKLKKQISSLREELEMLTEKSKDMLIHKSKNMHILDNAYDLGESVRQHGRHAAHQVADQALIMRDKVKENPKAAMAVVAAISFLAGAFFWIRR